MKLTNQEYARFVADRDPQTPWARNLLLSFLVGGGICAVGEGLFCLWETCGLELELAKTATPVALVFLGALFTALNIYDKLAACAGAGTLVPITGFANAMVSPAMEFKSEGLVMGMSARMFTVAGPVIVFGVVAAALYGVVLMIF